MQTNEVKTKRVHNLIIVDESGSMEVIRKQAFVGMNETLQTVRRMQEKFPDQEQFVTLLTFDSGHTTWHYDNLPAAQTKDLDWKAYCPGGGTPLYDAIGKGISKTNAQIEDGNHVLVTIITDGEEKTFYCHISPLLLQCFVWLLAVVSFPFTFSDLHIRENSRE